MSNSPRHSTDDVRAAVDRRMAEVGLRNYAELARASAVDPDTITALLDQTRTPRKGTRARIGRALRWAPEWLDDVRAGRSPAEAPDHVPTAGRPDSEGDAESIDLEFLSGRITEADEDTIRQLQRLAARELGKRAHIRGLEVIDAVRRQLTDDFGAVEIAVPTRLPFDLAVETAGGEVIAVDVKVGQNPGATPLVSQASHEADAAFEAWTGQRVELWLVADFEVGQAAVERLREVGWIVKPATEFEKFM